MNNSVLNVISNSPSGTKTVYYTGHIAYERGLMGQHRKTEKELNITKIANYVYNLYLDGVCILIQKKLSEKKYEYIAVTMPKAGITARAIKNVMLYNSVRDK